MTQLRRDSRSAGKAFRKVTSAIQAPLAEVGAFDDGDLAADGDLLPNPFVNSLSEFELFFRLGGAEPVLRIFFCDSKSPRLNADEPLTQSALLYGADVHVIIWCQPF